MLSPEAWTAIGFVAVGFAPGFVFGILAFLVYLKVKMKKAFEKIGAPDLGGGPIIPEPAKPPEKKKPGQGVLEDADHTLVKQAAEVAMRLEFTRRVFMDIGLMKDGHGRLMITCEPGHPTIPLQTYNMKLEQLATALGLTIPPYASPAMDASDFTP
jgi:hypothetical protein